MTWILLALAAPLLWAGSNLFDKYALEKVSRGIYDFLFFGTIGSFFVVALTLLVFGLDHVGILALVPIMAGFFVQCSYLFYSFALQKEDASYVVPLYMTYAAVVLLLSPLFGETITKIQLFAFGIVFLGTIILSLEKLSFEIFNYRRAVIFMIPAVLFISLATLLTNSSLKVLSFSDTFIYDLIGFSIAGIALMLVPKWRVEIVNGIRLSNMKKYILFLINDTLDMSGHLIFKYALLLAPSVGLVAVLNGIQPFYVLLLGGLLTLFFPHILSENISKREILQKVIGTSIIFIGIAILSTY